MSSFWPHPSANTPYHWKHVIYNLCRYLDILSKYVCVASFYLM